MLQLGLLAQMVERGADNAKAVSSILTQTIIKFFFADLLTVSLFYYLEHTIQHLLVRT